MRMLKTTYNVISALFFNPIALINRWRSLPYYCRNYFIYRKKSWGLPSIPKINELNPMLNDRYGNAGEASGHYFFMDIWAAQKVFDSKITKHIDVGSRIDGFVAHILSFCKVEYVDIRYIDSSFEQLIYKQGSITSLPYEDNSLQSISSLHVLEHIGLGRYGDEIDPLGYVKAAGELSRVLKKGGQLLLGVPVGKERVCFDAHRIFNLDTILKIFENLRLKEFSLINDKGDRIIYNAPFDEAKECKYGCGLFEFTKM